MVHRHDVKLVIVAMMLTASCASKEPQTPTVAPAADAVAIDVHESQVRVNGELVAMYALSARLGGIRATWLQLHPGRTYPDQCTLTADKDTRAALVKQIVVRVSGAGCRNIAFAAR